MQHLLTYLTQQLDTYYQQHHSRESFYNIFKVLEVSEKEVIMCRMLTDLLDPKGAHGRGNVFLKSFLEQVLLVEYTEEQLQASVVYKEYLIPESDRRIDIVIRMKNRFIPIEVKINAADQNSQCYDYWNFATEKMGDEEADIYYLTKFGVMPSKESLMSGNSSMPYERVKPISFERDIRQWLKKALENESGTVKTFLEQYLNAIEDFTGVVDEEVSELTKKAILSNKENFESALLIEKTITAAKISLISTVFEEFERQMDYMVTTLPFNMSRVGKEYMYYYKNKIDTYYKNAYSYPAVAYYFDDVVFLDNRKLLLHITIEDYIYAGLVVYDFSANEGEGAEVTELSAREKTTIKNNLKISDFEEDFFWGYLPGLMKDDSLTNKNAPNFRLMQGMVTSFVEDKFVISFVEQAVKDIKEKLQEFVM